MNLTNYLPRPLRNVHRLIKQCRPLAARTCPVCDYEGMFQAFGRPPRLDAQCPRCGSLERHRLFWLWFRQHQDVLRAPVLHFAAEPIFEQRFRERFCEQKAAYQTADLFQKADLKLDIENMTLQDGSQRTIICNHVLEHVDDTKALREIYRVLAPDGLFILSVPIAYGWTTTYENPDVTTPHEREVHFGQHDHVRFFGRDIRERLKAAGFAVREHVSTGSQCVTYGLLRGDTFFLCTHTSAKTETDMRQ